MLRRNPMALLNALGTPLAGVVLINALPPGEPAPSPAAGIAVTVTAFALIFAVYYNLVTALVARREELVLKRLRSGECGDVEIMIGAATPAVIIAWGQSVVGMFAATTVLGMAVPAHPLLVAAAVLLGTMVFVLLAGASTAMTRTVEMAQLSTLPVVAASMILGGLFPPEMLPWPLPWISQALPLARVVDLMWLGLTGTARNDSTVGGPLGGTAGALLVLAGWLVLGALAWRRYMRWEPRR